jgi:hypothetical protein
LERLEALEDGVDVLGVGALVEDLVEVDAGGDLGVRVDELAERTLLVPCAHRASLNEAIGLVALEAGLDERPGSNIRRFRAAFNALAMPHNASSHQALDSLPLTMHLLFGVDCSASMIAPLGDDGRKVLGLYRKRSGR